MPLNALKAKQANPKEKDYKISDEKGLYLLVKTTGAKYWRLKYRFAGKEKLLALGVYPEISLKKARERRDEARKLLEDDSDPSEIKRTINSAKLSAAENTFKIVAQEWYEKQNPHWSSSHSQRVKAALERDLYPSIANHPIFFIICYGYIGLFEKNRSTRLN